MSPLFAILELEREPLKFAEFGLYLRSWLEAAGGFSAIALAIYVVFVGLNERNRNKLLPIVLACGVLAFFAYAGATVFKLQERPQPPPKLGPGGFPEKTEYVSSPESERKDWCLAAGGAFTLFGIMLPFLIDLAQCRMARIWALAQLSFKEAIRRKILFVFLAFLLLFLFPTKWFVDVKKEDEIRQTVAVVDLGMTIISLLAFGLLAAVSIPNDVKNQTIHTVVTKPVQRFEVVLGRFIGYVGLATIVLVVLRTVALILIYASNPSPEAAEESFQARIPAYGELSCYNKHGLMKEADMRVGRETDYRLYIPGDPRTSSRARYKVFDIPAKLANEAAVPVEFAFDIFRTHRGEEGRGVQVSLFFQTPGWQADRLADYNAEVRRLGLNPNRNPAPDDTEAWAKWNEVADKFGYFQLLGKEIADYHTFHVYVPGGLFKRALATGATGDAANRLAATAPNDPTDVKAPLEVHIKCETRSQFLGVAKRDLYIRAGNMPFWFNFYKGAFGTWLLVVLVIGLAVSMSTFFSGVVSWLLATGLVSLGYFREFIQEIAEGRAVGGGPLEAFHRIAGNSNLITPLDNTPTAVAAQKIDIVLQWMYGRLLNAIPDVDRFDWSAHVAEGFNVPGSEMVLAFLLLVGYLLPWMVLGYYLMKSREVAN